MVSNSARASWSASVCRVCGTPRLSRWMAKRSSSWPTSKCRMTPLPRWLPARWAWGCSAANSCSWGGRASCPAKKSSTRPIGAPSRACKGCPLPSARWMWGPTSRWSLADPAMFRTQLRAILRAAVHGKVKLLIPMLAHGSEIRQALAQIDHARAELDNLGVAYGPIQLGAMIEIPAAALSVRMFLKHFDFLSIGTNDLIQYTLAIDRADESVAHLYDPLHPAVLKLVAETIAECRAQGKDVSVCGEMAGDVSATRLLLGLGLRSFSMHPSKILAIKQEVLRADTGKLEIWARGVLESDDPAAAMAA